MVAALIALAATTTVRAQSNMNWDEWIKSTRTIVPIKERGIDEGIEYRDKVCTEQAIEKREACKALAEKFIAYRRVEKRLIETILDAYDSNVEGRQVVATTLAPLAQTMAKLGTETGSRLDQLYPKKKAE